MPLFPSDTSYPQSPRRRRFLVLPIVLALAFGLFQYFSAETVTLPVVIGHLISRPGPVNSGMALAAGVILAVACAVTVLLVDLAVARGRGGAGIGGF